MSTKPDDLTQLANELMKLDDMLVSCMRCGLCQAVCPVYGHTLREADVTRGKIALLDNLAHKITTDAEGVDERLNRCLLCGSCESNCPSGVKIMDIFIRARAIVTQYRGLSPIKKLIFKGLLTRPTLFNGLITLSSKFQGLFLRKASDIVGTSCAPLLKPFIGERHFPSLAKQSLHTKVPFLDTQTGKSGLRVAFFPGCVTDKVFPNIGDACLKVFEKHGVGVFMPDGQVCCGIPALASGDRTSYDTLAEMGAELFSQAQFDYIITPCATCAATIKEVWPKLMESYPADLQSKIKNLHDKTMDITQFLVDVLKVEAADASAKGTKVTYHDSCHMRNSLGVTAQPRQLIAGLPGHQMVEMPEADRCCGSGGSFTLYHYDLSKDIGQRKRNNIISVSPDMVAMACPACMMQMMDTLSRNNDKISVKHVVELYADSL